jgi:hypothetical protein
MTTNADSRAPGPTPTHTRDARPRRRARLGWLHTFFHAALTAGHRLPEEPVALLESVPGPVRDLALQVEDHRSEFAAAARSLGSDYKGGYWMMYLIAPLAVACSATAVAGLLNPRFMSGLEFLLMAMILGLFTLMRRGGWQEKWIRARRTAEHLRYLPLVAPFVAGGGGNWYEQLAARRGLRIIVDAEVTRVCGLLDRDGAAHALRLEDSVFFAGYVRYVEDLLAQQIHYHSQKAEVEHALSHRVGLTSTAFFAFTIVCTLTLFLGNLAGRVQLNEYLRLCATVLPAIGAGLRGVLAQGESHRVATLSEGMAIRLGQLRSQLQSLPAERPSTDELESLVWNAVQELLSEADTWMRLQESAPLSVAG